MIKVGIVGGTGYTGCELLRLLAQHPEARVDVLTSRQEAGKPASALFPHLRGHADLRYTAPDTDALAACDAVFFATPHGTAMQMVPELLRRGVRVVDLSADFRLRSQAEFKRWYHVEHAAPELLAEAVYGLPEAHRGAIRKARLVGNPGCYPTAVQLGFLPLLEQGLVEPDGLVADCKSGVTGAGRELKLGSMFGEAAESFRAYGVPGHRHAPEIEQGLNAASATPVSLIFAPHLVPMLRGIHATLYARLRDPGTDLQVVFEKRYRDEPFVDVMPPGAHPDTRSVRGANTCRIAVHRSADGRSVIVLAVIDNLVKGAAGQAVQNLNLMFDLQETLGLSAPPLAP